MKWINDGLGLLNKIDVSNKNKKKLRDIGLDVFIKNHIELKLIPPSVPTQANQKTTQSNQSNQSASNKKLKFADEVGQMLTTINYVEPLFDPKQKYIITLLGYRPTNNQVHTNFFPWSKFMELFEYLGYQTEWGNISDLEPTKTNTKRRVYICWNEPTSLELYLSGYVKKDDIVFQKLTSLGKGDETANWGKDPLNYFINAEWKLYKMVENLFDIGLNIYAFGCYTITEPFPQKHRIVEKLKQKNRIFWLNWGSTVYNKQELEEARPIMDNFKYNVAYVGSLWGTQGRGNVDQFTNFLQPLLKKYDGNLTNAIFGSGLGGMITNEQCKTVLQQAKLCPIIHSPSWNAEQGLQDRFYTVFASGRFGVVDNRGVDAFFTEDEVVCETEPEKYIQKSLYYLKNTQEQFPYIEKTLNKIKTKYNFYIQWEQILNTVLPIHAEQTVDPQDYREMLDWIEDYK